MGFHYLVEYLSLVKEPLTILVDLKIGIMEEGHKDLKPEPLKLIMSEDIEVDLEKVGH